MARALWNGAMIAESDECIVFEGNHYFPRSSINWQFMRDSDKQTECPSKGFANYYHLIVDGQLNENAAWYYPSPTSAALKIQGYVAFWKGVKIQT